MLGRICFVLAGAIIALAINELAISVVAPSFNPRTQVHFLDRRDISPRLVTGIPNTTTRQIKNTQDYDVTVRINSFGFRDTKDISTVGPDDYVMVGDSFVFGWGVEEEQRVSNVLETLTGRRVFNIGINGNFDGYRALLDYAAGLGADIRRVIIGVTMENDLVRYDESVETSAPPTGTPAHAAGSMLVVKTWLMENSALYFAATTAVHKIAWIESLAIRLGLVVANLEGVREQRFDRLTIDSSAHALANLAQKYDTTIFLIPTRSLWYGAATEDAKKMHEAFADRLRALGLKVIDMRPGFEQNGNPLGYHFKNDGHWNPRGHALAAEIIASGLPPRRD